MWLLGLCLRKTLVFYRLPLTWYAAGGTGGAGTTLIPLPRCGKLPGAPREGKGLAETLHVLC